MITKETCVKIWHCHNEIEKSQELISTLAESLKNDAEKKSPTLHDAFGEKAGLQLGVPIFGSSGHSLYGVPIELGLKVIEKHIEAKRHRLEELMAIAKIELNG